MILVSEVIWEMSLKNSSTLFRLDEVCHQKSRTRYPLGHCISRALVGGGVTERNILAEMLGGRRLRTGRVLHSAF